MVSQKNSILEVNQFTALKHILLYLKISLQKEHYDHLSCPARRGTGKMT